MKSKLLRTTQNVQKIEENKEAGVPCQLSPCEVAVREVACRGRLHRKEFYRVDSTFVSDWGVLRLALTNVFNFGSFGPMAHFCHTHFER